MDLAERLKVARRNSGLTQDEVAERVHISRQAISQWETGKSSPDIENIKLLNDIYLVDNLLDSTIRIKQFNFRTLLNRKIILSILAGLLLLFLCFRNKDSFGYQWKCLDGDHYQSNVHILSDTAVDKANAHAAKYGHKVTIFKK